MKLWEYFNRAHTAILASLLMISFTAACGDDEEEKENKDTETKTTCEAKETSDTNKEYVWNENATGEKCTLEDKKPDLSEESSDVTYSDSTLTYTAKTDEDKDKLAGKNLTTTEVSVWVDIVDITDPEDMTVEIEISNGQVKLTGLDGETLRKKLEPKSDGVKVSKVSVVHVSEKGNKDNTFLTFTKDALQFLAEKSGVDFKEGAKYGDTNKGQEAMIKVFQDAINSDKFPADQITEPDAENND